LRPVSAQCAFPRTTRESSFSDVVKSLNDDRIHTLYFGGQRMEDGIGGQWHPSLRTHAIMAAKLSAAIAEKTDLPAAPVEIPPVTQATQ
jgi:hypothetical protein